MNDVFFNKFMEVEALVLEEKLLVFFFTFFSEDF